jgi:hypothetical protein
MGPFAILLLEKEMTTGFSRRILQVVSYIAIAPIDVEDSHVHKLVVDNAPS